MKAAGWVTLLAALGVAAGRPPEETAAPEGNLVDAALDVAEDKLAKMPGAPRLTRGELRALVDDAVGRRNKSLLVVLPVPASGAPLEELYTVKPVTQLVNDGSTTVTPYTTSRKPIKRRRKPSPRPVYVPSSQVPPSETTETVTKRTTSQPFTRRTSTTTKRATTDKGWAPLSELAVPEGFREPLDGMNVATTARVFVTPHKEPHQKISTTESSLPPADVAVAAQSLTPEMKELLATFGLLGPEAEAAADQAQKALQSTTEAEPLLEGAKPEVDPAAYLTFKPLPPAAGEMTPDMRGFLASFGLVPDNDVPLPPVRSRKVTREERRREPRVLKAAPQVDTDILPESLSAVLADLGLTGEVPEMSSRSGREHVFDPIGGRDANREAAAERLVARLRALSQDNDPAALTPDHLREILGEDAALLDGPNPLNVEELLNLAEQEGNDEFGGGDYKRQQPELGGLEVMDQKTSAEEASTSGEESSSAAASANSSGASASASAGSTSSATTITNSNTSSEDDSMETSIDDNDSPATDASPSGDSSSAAASATEEGSSSAAAASASGEGSSAAAAASSTGESSSSAAASSDNDRSSAAASSTGSDGSSAAAASASGEDSAAAAAAADGDSSSASASASAGSGGSRTTEGPSIQDLEDSFGGEITTTPRPNGLYFLLDWNSFLQVGQDERKVDLSFNPKIGDARNFYPIKFP